MALAFGAPIGLDGEACARAKVMKARSASAVFPVENHCEGIFKNLPTENNVWHSHCDEVKALPKGFRRTASNETCAIQAMQTH